MCLLLRRPLRLDYRYLLLLFSTFIIYYAVFLLRNGHLENSIKTMSVAFFLAGAFQFQMEEQNKMFHLTTGS